MAEHYQQIPAETLRFLRERRLLNKANIGPSGLQ